MKPARRRIVCSLSISALLFMQFAVAAHACGSAATAAAQTASSGSAAQTPPCAHDGNAPAGDQANDCVQHCQAGTESVDHRNAVIALPAAAPAPTIAWRFPARLALATAPSGSLPTRPPALYLLHCSLRT